jgi:predicted nucleic acid-binding protein
MATMMCLVDANVLCEATQPSPDPRVIEWLARTERDLAIDPVILGEIRFGILLLPPGHRRRALERWFDEVARRIHCIPWDVETGLRWAELLAHLRFLGKPMPIKDSLIAATALTHGLPLATRNRRDFEASGVELVDPFV